MSSFNEWLDEYGNTVEQQLATLKQQQIADRLREIAGTTDVEQLEHIAALQREIVRQGLPGNIEVLQAAEARLKELAR